MLKKFKAIEWAQHTNIYEVNIRQYTEAGNFKAFIKELPRLKAMGVDTLWLMPVTPISQKNKKGSLGSYYASSDYTAVNPEFGTIDELKELIRYAHELGLKIIIDWVANHTGWDHIWTVDYPGYYKIDPATNDFKMPGGMEDIIELDYSNPAMRDAMLKAMQFWVDEYSIDGFRCDLASWVELAFWKEARSALDKVKPLFWLGEFDELENPEYGEVFDASYSWAWMHKTEKFYKNNETPAMLLDLLKRYDDLGDSTMRTWFTSNHDENSWNGTEYEKYGAMARSLAVFSATWNGIPLIYSGQELPNTERLKFFDKDCIRWTGKYELHDFYKTLLTLHTSHPALRAGDPSVQTFRIKTTDPVNLFSYLRVKGDKEVLVLLNFSAQKIEIEITDEIVKGLFRNIFEETSVDLSTEKTFRLGPWEYLVFEK
ncbi:MAG: alpha-amylase family glycosyl hydrolase [Chitinophagaceae bacterium]